MNDSVLLELENVCHLDILFCNRLLSIDTLTSGLVTPYWLSSLERASHTLRCAEALKTPEIAGWSSHTESINAYAEKYNSRCWLRSSSRPFTKSPTISLGHSIGFQSFGTQLEIASISALPTTAMSSSLKFSVLISFLFLIHTTIGAVRHSTNLGLLCVEFIHGKVKRSALSAGNRKRLVHTSKFQFVIASGFCFHNFSFLFPPFNPDLQSIVSAIFPPLIPDSHKRTAGGTLTTRRARLLC